MIPWWVGSIIANLAVTAIEYFNHTSPYQTWGETLLWRTGLLVVLAQWGLYHSFNGASHWLVAWAVFTLGNAVTRLAAVYLLAGNQVGSWGYVLCGSAVMVAGSLLMKAGLR